MRCIDCGRFPFCCKIKNSQQKSCEEFVTRKLEIEIEIETTISKNLKQKQKREEEK